MDLAGRVVDGLLLAGGMLRGEPLLPKIAPRRFLNAQPARTGVGHRPGDEVRDNRLILTPKTLIEKRLAEGLDDLKRGRTYGPFSSPSALIRSLHHEAKQRKKP